MCDGFTLLRCQVLHLIAAPGVVHKGWQGVGVACSASGSLSSREVAGGQATFHYLPSEVGNAPTLTSPV
jgi:hypothetical protein